MLVHRKLKIKHIEYEFILLFYVYRTDMNFNSPQNLSASVGHLNQTYTFIEVFDTSADGRSGGLIHLNSGGIGHRTFFITIYPIAAQHPISVNVVAYSMDTINGGTNFRLGRFLPSLQLAYG